MQAVLAAPEAPTEIALDPERSYEFVDGQWEAKEMPGAKHAKVASRLDRRLGSFVEENNLGEVYVECSFQIGTRERIPDLAFLAATRIPPEGEPDTKWLIVPDIAIEVISPNDVFYDVVDKTNEYLEAGVKQVWHVNPKDHTITIYRSRVNIIAFPPEAELTCEDLLPGFRLPLSEVFRNVHVPMQN